MSRRLLIPYVLLSAFVFLLDRITKYYALTSCSEQCRVNAFLSFEVVFNRGISWGLLHSDGSALFLFVTFLIAAITFSFMFYAYLRLMQGFLIIGETLVIAGSLCNLIDRAWHKGVIDFIVLSYHDWSWPVFNIADAVIVTGVGVIIIQEIFKLWGPRKNLRFFRGNI